MGAKQQGLHSLPRETLTSISKNDQAMAKHE